VKEKEKLKALFNSDFLPPFAGATWKK